MAALEILAPLLLHITVYAAFDLIKIRTIGELILTLFAGAGTAITNPTIVPAIYTSCDYSIEELVTNDILNVEGHPEYTDEQVITRLGSLDAFNLDTQGFRNLMETNWQAMRDYQIDAVLRFNNIANTDSVYGAIDNLGQLVADVAQYGYLGFENSIAIVTNPLTSVRVGMENVRDAVRSILGLSVNDPSGELVVTGTAPSGYKYAGIKSSNLNAKYYNYLVPEGCYMVIGKINNSTQRLYNIVNNTDITQTYYELSNSNSVNLGGTLETTRTIAAKTWKLFASGGSHDNPEYPVGDMLFYNGSRTGLTDLLNSMVDNGIRIPNNYMIGQEGNYASQETGISEGQGIDIIPEATYQQFINDTNGNTQNEAYEDNALVYNDLINDFISDTDPEEDPVTPDIIPVQPTDFPVRPTVTPEEQITGMGGAIPGITQYFPFCIPGDFVSLIKTFNTAEREAPSWNLEIKVPSLGIREEIEIDLAEYDSVAAICRNVEYILFILGLMLITRKMIGAR